MTDRELLELAAKAAGYTSHGYGELIGGSPSLLLREADFTGMWAPLTDDGDALRLAVALRIEVSPCDGIVIVNYPCGPDRELFEIHEEIHSDRYASTRRAIVRAAAAIGETL